MSDDTPTPKPAEDEDDDALPVKLKGKPVLSRFGPAEVDYAVNKKLMDLIPKEAGSATLSITLKGEEGQRVVKTVAAVRGEGGWGAALGAALDLDDRRNWEIEFVGVLSWK